MRFKILDSAMPCTTEITIDPAETQLCYLIDDIATPFGLTYTNGTVNIVDFIKDMTDKVEALPKPAEKPITFDHQEDIKEAYASFAAATKEQREQLKPEVVEALETARQAYNDLFGDPNEDSANASDALMALQHSVKLTELGNHPFLSSDVNGDGKVDSLDALLILQFSVKLTDTFLTYILPV